jgi:hypothetical protein
VLLEPGAQFLRRFKIARFTVHSASI